jgi:hypothetical protein
MTTPPPQQRDEVNDDFTFAATGDYSPTPSVRLTVIGACITGSRHAGFLYPVADGAGRPLGNCVADRELPAGTVVEAAEVPPRNPPVTFNGVRYHYMQQP